MSRTRIFEFFCTFLTIVQVCSCGRRKNLVFRVTVPVATQPSRSFSETHSEVEKGGVWWCVNFAVRFGSVLTHSHHGWLINCLDGWHLRQLQCIRGGTTLDSLETRSSRRLDSGLNANVQCAFQMLCCGVQGIQKWTRSGSQVRQVFGSGFLDRASTLQCAQRSGQSRPRRCNLRSPLPVVPVIR